MNLLIGMLIGVIAGIGIGAVWGGVLYATSAGRIAPSGKRGGPRNYLNWSRRPILICVLIGGALGSLVGALVG